MQRQFRIFHLISIGLLLLIAFYNIFYHLGQFPIFSWDEARHGISAYEMLKRKIYLVNTYRNQVDYWNLKPPLSFWGIMTGYKIAGFNTFGLRFISALSTFLTIILVGYFTYKKHGKIASIISTLSLVTCTQLLIDHCARTGDADALFVLFFTASITSLLLSETKLSYINISGLAFSFAFLTKSWHAGNIAIIIGLYLILSKSYKRLNYRKWLLLIGSMFIPIIVWAAFRYQYDGIEFFKRMISYDLLERSSNPIEGHIGNNLFYFRILWKYFAFWLVILLGLLLLLPYTYTALQTKSDNIRYISGICLWIVIPLLFFTFAKTKVRWYIMPVYPALSIAIGALAGSFLRKGKKTASSILLVSILLVSLKYERTIHKFVNSPNPKLHVSLIQEVERKNWIRGYYLFFHHQRSKESWPQNMVLTAELYGELQVEDGGINNFLKREKALLILKKGNRANYFIEKYHLVTVAENKWGYIVKKSRSKN
jgi:4-amino-4-deoxy-L-arabinose transferase-like glycosyltransferase